MARSFPRAAGRNDHEEERETGYHVPDWAIVVHLLYDHAAPDPGLFKGGLSRHRHADRDAGIRADLVSA